jgi:hypothetical protein
VEKIFLEKGNPFLLTTTNTTHIKVEVIMLELLIWCGLGYGLKKLFEDPSTDKNNNVNNLNNNRNVQQRLQNNQANNRQGNFKRNQTNRNIFGEGKPIPFNNNSNNKR